MSTRFRPAIWTADFWKNTRYGIRDGKVYVEAGLFGRSKDSDTELMDVRRPSSRGWLVGHVTFEMKTGSTDVQWNNVLFPGAKKQAVIRAQEETSGPKQAAEKRRQETANLDLARESIIIPFPPDALKNILLGTRDKSNKHRGPTLAFECKPGQTVRKGSVVVRMSIGSLVAPCDGVLQHTAGNYRLTIWDRETVWPQGREIGFQTSLRNIALVLIQPLKNVAVPNDYVRHSYASMIRDAREAVERVRTYSDEELQSRFSHMHEEGPSELRNALGSRAMTAISMLEKAKPHSVVGGPIEELPEFPTQAWIEKNALTAGLEYIPAPEGVEEVGVDGEPSGKIERKTQPTESAPRLSDEERKALDLLNLDWPCSREEVKNKHLRLVDRVPESRVNEVNRAYEVVVKLFSA